MTVAFIDDQMNTNIGSQSRAKGSLWFKYSAHNIIISGDNEEVSVAPTPARRVEKVGI